MSSETHSLGKRMLLRVRILQVLVALPAIAYFLNAGYNYWSHPYDVWYFFTISVVGGFMATGIVFIASSQRTHLGLDLQTCCLEAVKSFLATLLWLYTDPFRYNVKRTFLATSVLVFVFYVPLAYAYWAREPETERKNLKSMDKHAASAPDNIEKSPVLENCKQ